MVMPGAEEEDEAAQLQIASFHLGTVGVLAPIAVAVV